MLLSPAAKGEEGMGSEMGEFKPLNRSNRGASVTIEGKNTDENEGTIIKSKSSFRLYICVCVCLGML